MRCSILVLALSALFALPTSAQDVKAASGEAAALRSYTVTLVEFHLKSATDPALSLASIAKDFDKLTADGKVSLSETVRLSVLEKYQTNVLFGRLVTVTMGVTQSQFGKTRNAKQQQLGTGVKVTAEPMKDKVLLKLDYQASRIVGEVKEDATPDIESVKIDADLLLDLGTRMVVAGTSTSSSTYLMVSVTQ